MEHTRSSVEDWTTGMLRSLSICSSGFSSSSRRPATWKTRRRSAVSPAVKAGSHPFVLNVLSPDGLTVAQVNGIVVVGSEKRTMFSLPLQASIQKYGPWKVRFASAEVTCETSLEIRPNQGGSASGNV